MFDADRYEVRRRPTADGVRYRVTADGELALVATYHRHRLDRDVVLSTPDGNPVLRVTPDTSAVEPAGTPGSLALAFAVQDERDERERDERGRSTSDSRAGRDDPRAKGETELDREVVGLVSRDFRSLYRRHWSLLDPYGLETATLVERSRLLGVLRHRFVRLVPYRYVLRAAGDDAGRLHGRLFRGYDLDVDADAVDLRLALGASVLVDAVETVR